MTIRPKRKDPLSTKPVYLPIIPTKAIEAAAGARPRGAAVATAPAEAAILIYTDSHIPGLDLQQVAQALGAAGGVKAVASGELFAVHLASLMGTERRQEAKRLAYDLAWSRIREPWLRRYEKMPLHGEVDYELSRLRAELHPEFGETEEWGNNPSGALYDGPRLQELYRELIPRLERHGQAFVLVNQRLGRWSEEGKRWEPVSLVKGEPTLVSVPTLASQPDRLVFQCAETISEALAGA